jgi:hypothetical protein
MTWFSMLTALCGSRLKKRVCLNITLWLDGENVEVTQVL